MGNDKKRDLIIEALSRYLPKRIVEKIVMEPEKIHLEGERRRATILFMDISGFTAISENLDPEEVVSTVNGFFNAMSKIIDKYGGDIDKFMGDAMLVLWGTPVAHEDDDERAVRAGMEMMAALDDYNMSRPKEIREKFPISMTMGINSGVVFAGNVGSEKRMEYTVMGDNVNLAARLEGMANPREIMISGETAKNLSDEILLKDLGKVPVKGKVEPVQVYLIAGLKSEMGEVFEKKSFYIKRPKLEKKLLDLVENNDFVEVIGEAGTGKTELVRHTIEDFHYFSINASDKNTPFGFIKNALSNFFKISLTDNAKQKQLKIQAFLKTNNEFLNELSTLIDLFGIKSIFKGEEKKWKVFELAEKIFNKFFNNVIIDKFDLIDELSLNFIKGFIETSKGKKILFITRERILPELPSLEIPVFTNEETKNYILKYFNKKYAPDEIIEKIYHLSKGNVSKINGLLNYLEKNNLIFLEEEAVYLRVPIDKIKLPDEFQGVVLSIFDSNDEYTKKFLQYGAVFGEKFNVNDLNKIINYKPGRIEGSLRNLVSDNILKREGNEISFIDENFRVAVYNILLKSKRKELHTKIADIFEKNEYDTFSIAHHFLLGKDKKKAIEYGKKAIEISYDNYDNSATLNYAEKLLGFISQDDTDDLIYVLEKKMKALYRLSYFELAIKEAKKLSKILEKNNLNEKLFDILINLSSYHIHLENTEKTLGILNNLLENENNIKDKNILKALYINLGFVYKAKNEINKSMEFFLKSLNIAKEYDLSKENIFMNLGQLYFMKRNIGKAKDFFQFAEKESNKTKDLYNLALALLELGKCGVKNNSPKKAIEYFNRALNIAKERKIKYIEGLCLNSIATLYKDIHNFSKSIDIYNQALFVSKGLLDFETATRIYFNLGTIYSLTNQLTDANKSFSEGLKYSKRASNILFYEINLEQLTLYRKMGLTIKYSELSGKLINDNSVINNDFLFSFCVLHQYISLLELKEKIPSKLSDNLEKIKQTPIWNDLGIVYDFFSSISTRNFSITEEISKIVVNEIKDPSLTSFLFPEIADILKSEREMLEQLNEILNDEITSLYIKFLKENKLKDSEIEVFYENGLYQIYEKIMKKLDKKIKKGKIKNEERLFLEL